MSLVDNLYQNIKRSDTKGSFAIYLFIFFLGYILYYFLRGHSWTPNQDFHTLTEIIGAFIALFVAVLAYVRYFTRKNNMFLFISAGFMVEGVFKGIHAIVTSRFFDHIAISGALITWTSMVARIIFPSLLLLSFLTENHSPLFSRINNKLLYGVLSIILGASLYIIILITPSSGLDTHLQFITGKLELHLNDDYSNFINDLPIIFYLFTIFFYIEKGDWRERAFDHWLIISLIFGGLAELIYILAHISSDIIFSHLYKNISYLILFIGLLLNMSKMFRQATKSSKEIEEMNYSLMVQKQEREKLQEGLEESEERYRLLVENSPDMIAVVSKGKWAYINTAGRKMLGASCKNNIVGLDVFHFIAPEERDLVKQTMMKLHKQKSLQSPLERHFVTLQGSIINVEVQAIASVYEGEPIILIIARDISERKKSEELIRKSEKLSVVGELAAGIAHEIRNPLTSLNGFIQLIQKEENNKDQFYNIMLSELNRIELIISELLVLAKPHNLSKRTCNIVFLLEHVIALLNIQATSLNITIENDVIGDIPLIRCEENQLKQVFINIIKNAIEAMPNGGQIKVIVEILDKNIMIHFKDQGMGIPTEILQKIGQPFYTTKQTGTGLGLMISKKIIEDHQGIIKIDSDEEKGTVVSITLPLI